MRLLVCGGRDYDNVVRLRQVLTSIDRKHTIRFLINGGASGADELARDWAREIGIPLSTFVADWKHLGKTAGPIRNQRMISEGKPNAAVAFTRRDGSWGKGTSDMIERLIEAKIPVWRIQS